MQYVFDELKDNNGKTSLLDIDTINEWRPESQKYSEKYIAMIIELLVSCGFAEYVNEPLPRCAVRVMDAFVFPDVTDVRLNLSNDVPTAFDRLKIELMKLESQKELLERKLMKLNEQEDRAARKRGHTYSRLNQLKKELDLASSRHAFASAKFDAISAERAEVFERLDAVCQLINSI